ncbi:hypothetical protein lerEdw1_019473 [Lerista edwardsae]|nr:hypothetical protein lerEdw1_019473 [Lerista edwardsae]
METRPWTVFPFLVVPPLWLAIYFYTVEVFRTAKLEEALIPYVALGLGTSEFVSVVLCFYMQSSIIDRFGRKILLWGGFGLMAVVMALLIVTLSLQDRFPWMSYGSISLIFLFVVFYGLGPSGAIFALVLEMFNQSARASVFIIAGTIGWVGLFLNGMLFPFVVVRCQRLFQLLLVLGVGGTLPIGYQISVINYPSQYIKRFMNETWLERYGAPLGERSLLFLWSAVVSVYGLGGLLGCLCSSPLMLRYGKKRSLLATDLLIMATACLLGFSKTAGSLEMVLAGRFLYGVSAGFGMMLHTQYAGEASPKRLRGLANATTGLFWSLGKSLGQVLGLRELLGTDSAWPLLLAFTGGPALLQLLLLPSFPESPSYLLIQKGDEGACLQAMQQLWGNQDHREELGDLKKELVAGQGSPVLGARALLGARSWRQQVHVLVAVVVTLQLCGINAVYFYASEVFRTAGFEEGLLPYLSLGVGFCELLSALLCIFTIEKLGRRRLLWLGCSLMALALLLLTVSLALQKKHPWMSPCSVALIFAFVIFFGVGPNGASMSVMMEIFSQSARPAAFLIGGCLNWAGLFLVGLAFPYAVAGLGPFCFLFFMVVLVGSAGFFYLFLPETKGKSIADITEEFSTSLPFGERLSAVLQRGLREDLSVYANF